jgi:predicted AAA+ superfamily ATPase
MDKEFITRDISAVMLEMYKYFPVLTMTGPRQSGKTTLLRKVFKELPYYSLENLDIRHFALNDPVGFLNQHPEGMILDEVQNTPDLLSYIQGLVDQDPEKRFVVEDMPAWNPNLRSKTAIRTADTRFFVDPSIATAALGLGPADLLDDLNTMGLFFETMCVRDLRVFAEALNGKVYHYRDKNKLECDAVVHLRNGQYGLIEIKLGGESLINKGVETLNTLTEQIDTTHMKAPAFKMILTATSEHAYRRPEDGIYVVPIGTLKD